MGFTTPRIPGFDVAEWRTRLSQRRLDPRAGERTIDGPGVPTAGYLVQFTRVAAFVGGAAALMSLTRGVGSIDDITSWWADPIVYQKFVVWTLLWEILGLGSVSLTSREMGPVGGFRYGLRRGTMRLAPWPGRIPLTAGTRRTTIDVGLYAGVLVVALALLGFAGTAGGTLPSPGVGALLVLLMLLGLRDKASLLAARPGLYAVMLVVFLFPPTNMVFALKLVMLAMWWGLAASNLNVHFPFVAAVMLSDTPWHRSVRATKLLWIDHPTDLRPSDVTRRLAHGSTALEFVVPLVLIFSGGGELTAIAVTIMVLLHVLLLVTLSPSVPLAGNVFVIFSTLFLFGHYAGVGAGSLDSAGLGLLLAVVLVGLPVVGIIRPGLVPFSSSRSCFTGNSATSVWMFRNDGAEEHFGRSVARTSDVATQRERGPDEQAAELLRYKGLTFRAMHLHEHARNGLLCRAVGDLTRYTPRDGEAVAGVALGWNSGDGHRHDRRLLEAIQERCGFAPGQLRVITLEPQPIHRAEQHYRILDAADGLIEEGLIEVEDMIARSSWLDPDDATIPVEVLFSVSGFRGYTTPAAFSFLSDDDAQVRRPRPPVNGHTNGNGNTNGNGHTHGNGLRAHGRPIPTARIPHPLPAPVPASVPASVPTVESTAVPTSVSTSAAADGHATVAAPSGRHAARPTARTPAPAPAPARPAPTPERSKHARHARPGPL